MNNQTKNAVVLQIADVVGPLLEPQGFVRRRHRFEAADRGSNIRGYEISLSRSKAHLALHLRLTLLERRYEEVLSKSRSKNEVALFFKHLTMH
ncbi:hypothetical protein [Xanthomonas sp. 3307]|uniref:hypothetical protein n=1 Tax=Xanthomonas sp. 3307 TaxID=3035316 RepID=UPI0016146ABB|nr:hypothetical protein [Xanthomonas sp. 3307]MBB5943869.1 hypothetical protein [Xanthomonas sp. 3307]